MRFTTCNLPASYDTRLILCLADKTPLVNNDDHNCLVNSNLRSLVTYTLTSSVTYCIVVTGFSVSNHGVYQLRYNSRCIIQKLIINSFKYL